MPDEFLSEKEKKVLEVEVRRSLYQLVKRYAGAHFRELVRKSNLATGTVQYHLDYLSKHKLIRAEKKDNNLRYFPKELEAANTTLLSLLRQRSVRQILLYILNNSPCNHEHITNSLSISGSTVSWHLKKLEQSHIITSQKKGRKTEFTLTTPRQKLLNVLVTYQDTFFDRLVDNTIELWEST